MSDPVERIAEILTAHPDRWDGSCCHEDDVPEDGFDSVDEWARHVGRRITTELRFEALPSVTEWTWTYPNIYNELDYGAICDTREEAELEGGGLPDSGVAYRYVTEWKVPE